MPNTITTTMQQDYTANQANALDYAMQQILLDINTYLPCKVLAVNNDGLSLNVQPVINGLDASGNPIIPPIIYNAAIHQLTGGTGASCAGIIIDYAVGDIVGVIFCQRDISASQGTDLSQDWKAANPSSYRKFNMADAVVIMRLGGAKPVNNFIHLNHSGIIITANSNPITINAANVDITATLTTIHGNLTVTGTIQGNSVKTDAGLILDGHVHENGGLPSSPSAPAQNP